MTSVKSVKKSNGSALLIGLAFAVLLVVDSIVEAEGHITRFTAVDVTCEQIHPGTTTVDPDTGDIVVEGTISTGVIMSDNELIAGRSYIIVDSFSESGSATVKLWVTAIYYPDAVDGSWIAPGKGQVPPLLVHHFGHGTRALRHAFIKFVVREATDVENLPCEPVIPPAKIEGVIIK